MDTIRIARNYSQMLINQYDPDHWCCTTITCTHSHDRIVCDYCPFSFITPNGAHDIETIHRIYESFHVSKEESF